MYNIPIYKKKQRKPNKKHINLTDHGLVASYNIWGPIFKRS